MAEEYPASLEKFLKSSSDYISHKKQCKNINLETDT